MTKRAQELERNLNQYHAKYLKLEEMREKHSSTTHVLSNEDDDALYTSLEDILQKFGLNKLLSTLKALPRGAFLRVYSKPLSLLSDYYFAMGKLYFRRRATPVRGEYLEDGGSGSMSNSASEEAWFNLLTAASIGQKHARAYIALMLENGMVPSSEVFAEYCGEGKRYEYINYITDIK